MTYLFDTNTFVAWWHEIYPVKIFADVAELIARDVHSKVIQSPVEVRHELEEKAGDTLTEWVKEQSSLFIATQPDVI